MECGYFETDAIIIIATGSVSHLLSNVVNLRFDTGIEILSSWNFKMENCEYKSAKSSSASQRSL